MASVLSSEAWSASLERNRGVVAPRQSRSFDKLSRILETTERLLDGRDFEQIPIAEICQTAGVSASSFYARFKTKEALMRCLHERHVERRSTLLRTLVSEVDWDSLSVPEVVRTCLAIYLRDRVANARFLRSVMLAELEDRGASDARARLDVAASSLIENYLMSRIGSPHGSVRSEALRRRMRFATRAVTAAAIAAVVPPQRFAEQLQMGEPELLDELTRMWLRTVDLPSEPA